MPKPIRILAFVALATTIAAVTLCLVIRSQLSVDSLVAKLEENYQLRAQVGGHRAKILAHPGRSLASGSLVVELVLEDLVLAPRDEVVEAGTPHSEREALADARALLAVENAELEVDLGDLLGRELNIRRLVLHGLRAAITIDAQGSDSLSPLFAERGGTKADPANPADEKPRKENHPEAIEASADRKVFLPIPATLDRAAITEGSLVIDNHRQGSRTTLEDFRLELTDIRVDPDNPTTGNHCALRLDTRLTMANLKSGKSFLDFMIHSEGKAEPLDHRDGSLAPSLDAQVVIARGSSVAGLPFLGMLSGSIEVLSRIGLKLGDLESRSILAEDASTALLYREGKLLFPDPLELDFDRYSLGLGEGSWLNLGTLDHEFKGRITVSEELTTEACEGVENFIRDKAGDTVADAATGSLLEPLINAAGRLSLGFLSSGPLADPEVGIVTPIGDIGSVMEGIGEKLIRGKGGIEGLLKGLLD